MGGAVEEPRVVHVPGSIESSVMLIAAKVHDLARVQKRGVHGEDAGGRVIADLDPAAEEFLHDDGLAQWRDVLAQALLRGYRVAADQLATHANREVCATTDGAATENSIDVNIYAGAGHDIDHAHRVLAGIERFDHPRGLQALQLADHDGGRFRADQTAPALHREDLVVGDEQWRHRHVDLGGVGRALADGRTEHR